MCSSAVLWREASVYCLKIAELAICSARTGAFSSSFFSVVKPCGGEHDAGSASRILHVPRGSSAVNRQVPVIWNSALSYLIEDDISHGTDLHKLQLAMANAILNLRLPYLRRGGLGLLGTHTGGFNGLFAGQEATSTTDVELRSSRPCRTQLRSAWKFPARSLVRCWYPTQAWVGAGCCRGLRLDIIGSQPHVATNRGLCTSSLATF